jgi:hypothetical protein
MARYADTLWCDGCGVEIVWAPLVAGERHYCCADCFDGFPCKCGERLELEEGRRAGTPESPAISISGIADTG